MKKGLSILLVAAALFGFYGGAVNLNDVLDCKDYWEEQSEISTANMNKLEDGLNQLKDNEQAYLDGKDQVAEGEKTLAEGEKTLADGEAQYAQGLADYEAAPKKLADGKKTLDDNKASYEAGKAFKSIVDKASKGLSNKGAYKIIKELLAKTGTKGVPASYKEMASTRSSLKQLKKGTDDITGMGSNEAFKVAVGTQDKATQKQLKDAGVTSYKKLVKAIDAAGDGIDSLNLVKDNVDRFTGKTEAELKEMLVKSSEDLKAANIKDYKTLAGNELKLRKGKERIDYLAGLPGDELKEALVDQNEDLKAADITSYDALAQSAAALTGGKKQIDDIANMKEAELKDFLAKQNGIDSYKTLATNEAMLSAGVATIKEAASSKDGSVKNSKDLQKAEISTYEELAGSVELLTKAKNDIDDLFLKDKDARKQKIFEEQKIDAFESFAVLEGTSKKLTGDKAECEKAEDKNQKAVDLGYESYEALANQEEYLSKIVATISESAESKDGAVKNNAQLDAKGITSYAVLEGKWEALSAGKEEIDDLFLLDESARRDALVKKQEIKNQDGSPVESFAALTKLSETATAGKKTIDDLAADRSALKETLLAKALADEKTGPALKKAGIKKYADLEAKEAALSGGKQTIDALAAMSEAERKEGFVQANEDLQAAGITSYSGKDGLAAKATALTQGKAAVDTVSKNLDKAGSDKAMAFVWTQLTDEQKAALKAQGVDGTSYAALKKAIASVEATRKSLKKLKAGTDGITNMKSNAALKTAIGTQDKATQKKLKDSGITSYKALKSAISKLNQLAGFTNALTAQNGNSRETTYGNIVKTLKNAGYGSMVSALPGSYRQLASKLAEYDAGMATYKQGLADYAAAPAKLADAEKQLEDGRKALEEGRQALADGKAKLAEYEDGEQQVRDGLATLAGTQADLDLTSILDRLNGDDDFDNGDNHLELDEGLSAVEVGRGYQADDGVLITKEIMARAVGTGALLGAGVLALIAALLSFLKKNKGAGVFAILAAAAGAFGAYYGTNAGTYFSDVAGSTAGSAGWVAAGIIGVIALAHAIVHFTAKKEA